MDLKGKTSLPHLKNENKKSAQPHSEAIREAKQHEMSC